MTAGTLSQHLHFNIKHVLKSFQQPKRTTFCLILATLYLQQRAKTFFGVWNWFRPVLDSISWSLVLRTPGHLTFFSFRRGHVLLWLQLNGYFQCLSWEIMGESFYEMLNSIAFIHLTSVFKHVWEATLAAQKWTKNIFYFIPLTDHEFHVEQHVSAVSI